MANPEILKEVIPSPEVPAEPFVKVRVDNEIISLTLTQVLQEIQKSEERRRIKLSQKAKEIRKSRSHGSVVPLSRRVQNDIIRSLEREARRNPSASSYPLVSYILRSPPNKPFQISGKVSFRSERFPKEGEENLFYRFICDRPIDKALEILNQPETKKVLWQIFFHRLEFYQKVSRGEISFSEALNQFMEKTKKITFPESLIPLVGEIGRRFPLTQSRNNYRRF